MTDQEMKDKVLGEHMQTKCYHIVEEFQSGPEKTFGRFTMDEAIEERKRLVNEPGGADRLLSIIRDDTDTPKPVAHAGSLGPDPLAAGNAGTPNEPDSKAAIPPHHAETGETLRNTVGGLATPAPQGPKSTKDSLV